MPFDLVGFYQSTTCTTLTAINAVADDIYRTSGADLYIQSKAPYLLGFFQYGASTPKYMEIRQPGILVPPRFYKSVIASALDPGPGLSDHTKRPFPLLGEVKANVYSMNASNEINLAILALGSGRFTQEALDKIPAVTHVITGSSTTDAVAGAWTKLAVTWDQSLPAGRYAVVGMKAWGAKAANPGVAAYRLILLDTTWRPGVIGGATTTIMTNNTTDNVNPLQTWPLMPEISFRHDQTPSQIEVLSGIANTDESFQLDLIQIK